MEEFLVRLREINRERWLLSSFLLLSLLAVGFLFEEALVRFALERRAWFSLTTPNGDPVYILGSVHRFDGSQRGHHVGWYAATGHKYSDGDLTRHEGTIWRPDGTVLMQYSSEWGVLEHPPWHWGVSDECEPGAPWVRAGMDVDDWWAATGP